jgi:CheY-like chemotaxis protein
MEPLTLLIIEPHTAVRRALTTRLRSAKLIQEVSAVATMAEALDQIIVQKPDVILLGVRHPRTDELKPLMDQVQQLVNRGCSVVALASYADEIERETLLQAGANQYLLKTIDTPQLIEAIENAVGSSRKTAVSPPHTPLLLPRPAF